VFEAASARLREAGADIVEKLPASSTTLQRIAEAAFTSSGIQVSRFSSSDRSGTPRPRLADTGAGIGGLHPTQQSPLYLGPTAAASAAAGGVDVNARQRSPLAVALIPDAFQVTAKLPQQQCAPKMQLQPSLGQPSAIDDIAIAGDAGSRVQLPAAVAPEPEARLKSRAADRHPTSRPTSKTGIPQSPFMPSGGHSRPGSVPALASLAVAGVLQVRI
jgi:hypothetical protein